MLKTRTVNHNIYANNDIPLRRFSSTTITYTSNSSSGQWQFKKKKRPFFSLENPWILGGKHLFFSVTSFLNDINVFYIIIICSFLIQGGSMSYLTFIFMGFITMLSKFAPDRYMNHISTSMIVVTCIDAYSHHKTDDWRLTLKQYENNSRPFYSD